MKQCFVLLLIAAVAPSSTHGRSNNMLVRRLVLQPAKFDPAVPFSLILPMDDSRTDGDGAAFYLRANQAIPEDLDLRQVIGWIKASMDELPSDQVQAAVR